MAPKEKTFFALKMSIARITLNLLSNIKPSIKTKP